VLRGTAGNQMDTKGEAQAAHTEGESTEAKGLAHSSAPQVRLDSQILHFDFSTGPSVS
jgi:hypothetical protein